MNDDTSKLTTEPTANTPEESLEHASFAPDDPVFALAGEVYERLREDLSPEEALAGGVETGAGFIRACNMLDENLPAWGWILEPVFDLPVGWSTPGADAEGAALAREKFDLQPVATVVAVPDAATYLALPVMGHDGEGKDVAGGLIAIPLQADSEIDDNVMIGASAGAGIVAVQMENSVRARAARRSLQFAQAASNTQRKLVEPTDRREAILHAMNNLASCDALTWGSATEFVDGEPVEVIEFGERPAEIDADDRVALGAGADPALATQDVTLPVLVEGAEEARIDLHSFYPLGSVERDTLASVAAAVAGTIVRFRSAETIESLRRSATRRLVEAQERERSMVAADIHDGVLQQLGATAIRLELAQSRVEQRDFDTASAIIADGAKEIRSCARELRALLMELRPQVLDDNGLNAALNELGRHVSNTEVTVTSDLPEDLGSEFAITIFRIVQEALTNIEKHARAAHARVDVSVSEDAIAIDISDDGVGYEGSVTGPSAEGSHLGLLGMRERAQMFGGSFSIAGASGGGTEIRAVLPLDGLPSDAL
ncbi:MAG: sensor histidine kinase [Solirubrobacterales bacterium]